MTVVFLKDFRKEFRALPLSVQKKTLRQIKLLSQDLRHPGVHARKMTGVGDIWEGRVDRSFRFTFHITDDALVIRRVGTHEIYRRP